jgi:hypothetical protein
MVWGVVTTGKGSIVRKVSQVDAPPRAGTGVNIRLVRHFENGSLAEVAAGHGGRSNGVERSKQPQVPVPSVTRVGCKPLSRNALEACTVQHEVQMFGSPFSAEFPEKRKNKPFFR